MPRRALAFLTFAWLLLGCACNRTEEPAAPSTTEAPPAGGSTTSSAGSRTMMSDSTVCTVPFEVAPVVSKATECPKDPTGNLKLAMGRVTFVDAPGAPSVDVELARDAPSMERGLMYRTSMPEDSGMLFSYQNERRLSFWMKNTCIPLDMLFIRSDGIISGILEHVPTLNLASRTVACPVTHVLELNAGWARAHGIAPGMKVAIEG